MTTTRSAIYQDIPEPEMDNGAVESKMCYLFREDVDVHFLRPSYTSETIFRPLPARSYSRANPGGIEPYAPDTTHMGGLGNWVRFLPAVYMAGQRGKRTFFLRSPKDAAKVDLNMTPPGVLNQFLWEVWNDAPLEVRGPSRNSTARAAQKYGGKLYSQWGRALSWRKSVQNPRTGKHQPAAFRGIHMIYLVQGVCLAQDNRWLDADEKGNRTAFPGTDKPCVLCLPADTWPIRNNKEQKMLSVGQKFFVSLSRENDDFSDYTDPAQRFACGDVVNLQAGSFLRIYSGGVDDFYVTQKAARQNRVARNPKHPPDSTGYFLKWDASAAPHIDGDILPNDQIFSDAFEHWTYWEHMFHYPSMQEQAKLLQEIFDADVLLAAFEWNGRGFITQDLRAAAAQAESVSFFEEESLEPEPLSQSASRSTPQQDTRREGYHPPHRENSRHEAPPRTPTRQPLKSQEKFSAGIEEELVAFPPEEMDEEIADVTVIPRKGVPVPEERLIAVETTKAAVQERTEGHRRVWSGGSTPKGKSFEEAKQKATVENEASSSADKIEQNSSTIQKLVDEARKRRG